jgi:hypothetical protein
MLVEIAGSDILWCEPRDLTLDDVLDLNRETNRLLADHHYVETGTPLSHPVPGPLRVATADGKTHTLPQLPSEEEWIELLDPGPKSIDIRVIAGRSWPRARPKWSGILGLGIMVAAYVGICCMRFWPVQERYDTEEPSAADREGASS